MIVYKTRSCIRITLHGQNVNFDLSNASSFGRQQLARRVDVEIGDQCSDSFDNTGLPPDLIKINN